MPNWCSGRVIEHQVTRLAFNARHLPAQLLRARLEVGGPRVKPRCPEALLWRARPAGRAGHQESPVKLMTGPAHRFLDDHPDRLQTPPRPRWKAAQLVEHGPPRSRNNPLVRSHTGSPIASTQSVPFHQTGWLSVVSKKHRPSAGSAGRAAPAVTAGPDSSHSDQPPSKTLR